MISPTLVIFDLETTGVDTSTDDFVQIGTLVQKATAFHADSYMAYAKPMKEIPGEATEVHHITNERVMKCRPSAEVAQEWWSVLQSYGTDPLVICGHNVWFDIEMIRKHVPWPPALQVIDTYQIAHRLDPELPSHKLESLYSVYGTRGDVQAHDALEDCWMVRDILLAYLERTGKSILEMVEWLQEPFLLHKMPFGKFKGQPFSEINAGYLGFMLRKDLSADVRHSMQQALRGVYA